MEELHEVEAHGETTRRASVDRHAVRGVAGRRRGIGASPAEGARARPSSELQKSRSSPPAPSRGGPETPVWDRGTGPWGPRSARPSPASKSRTFSTARSRRETHRFGPFERRRVSSTHKVEARGGPGGRTTARRELDIDPENRRSERPLFPAGSPSPKPRGEG